MPFPSHAKEAPGGALWKEASMWLALATLFLIIWLITFVFFHVAFAAIHILLGLCVIFIIVHFIAKAKRRA